MGSASLAFAKAHRPRVGRPTRLGTSKQWLMRNDPEYQAMIEELQARKQGQPGPQLMPQQPAAPVAPAKPAPEGTLARLTGGSSAAVQPSGPRRPMIARGSFDGGPQVEYQPPTPGTMRGSFGGETLDEVLPAYQTPQTARPETLAPMPQPRSIPVVREGMSPHQQLGDYMRQADETVSVEGPSPQPTILPEEDTSLADLWGMVPGMTPEKAQALGRARLKPPPSAFMPQEQGESLQDRLARIQQEAIARALGRRSAEPAPESPEDRLARIEAESRARARGSAGGAPPRAPSPSTYQRGQSTSLVMRERDLGITNPGIPEPNVMSFASLEAAEQQKAVQVLRERGMGAEADYLEQMFGVAPPAKSWW